MIGNINSTAAAALFRCSPELDYRNSWYQELALVSKFWKERTQWVNISSNYFTPDINVTRERNTTAKGTVNFSKRFLEFQNFSLFLDSFLTLDLNSVVKTIQYRYIKAIRVINIDGGFEVERDPSAPKTVEGETITITCETFGINPPAVTVERNGMTIFDTDDVYISSINSNLRKTSYVTFLHATKEIEGNYTCVLGDGSMFPLYDFKLKPRVRSDLMHKFNITEGVR